MTLSGVQLSALDQVQPYRLANSGSGGDAVQVPKRPALRYLGGKWKLAPWILQHLPPHQVYVEPYAGAFSVGLRKPLASVEVLNDLNLDLVNFFQVLRHSPGALVAALEASPRTQDEFDLCKVIAGDSLEKARRFYLYCQLSYGNGGGRWSSGTSQARLKLVRNQTFEHLLDVAQRLAAVEIQHGTALDAIAAYDSPDTLFYVDPPYVQSVRGSKDSRHIQGAPRRQYACEMVDDDHRQLAEVLTQVKGQVVLSGYRSDLYVELFPGWRRIEKSTRTSSRGQRIECLWLKPPALGYLAFPPSSPERTRQHRAKGKASGWIESRVGNTKRKKPSVSYYYRWDSPAGRVTVYIRASKVAVVGQMVLENRPALKILQVVVTGRKVTGVTARVLGLNCQSSNGLPVREISN